MAILLDCNPDGLIDGTTQTSNFTGFQVQPPVSGGGSYQSANVPGAPGGSWDDSDFCQVVSPPTWGGHKAWQLTYYPAPGFGIRQRTELMAGFHRNENPAIGTRWTDDTRLPSNVDTVYIAERMQWGYGGVGYDVRATVYANMQIKAMGYNDPAISGTSETINYQSTPWASFYSRGADLVQEITGGVYLVQDPSNMAHWTPPGYYSNSKNQWGKRWGDGFFQTFKFYDVVWEIRVSLGRYTAVGAVPTGTPAGYVKMWMRKEGDANDWSDVLHLQINSLTQTPGTEAWIEKNPNAAGPRRVGVHESWNYQGATSSGFVNATPGGGVTDGYLIPQGSMSTGIYCSGYDGGQTVPLRLLIGRFRVCTTSAEAFALYSGSAPSGSPPAIGGNAPSISGTPRLGQTLTADTGQWLNSPTSYSYQWKRDLFTPDSNDIVLDPGTYHLGYVRLSAGQVIRASGPGVIVYGTLETRPGDDGCGVIGYGDSGRITWRYENDLTGGAYRAGAWQIGGANFNAQYVNIDCLSTVSVQGVQLLTDTTGSLRNCWIQNLGTSGSLGADHIHGIYLERHNGFILRDILIDGVPDGYGLHFYNGADTGACQFADIDRVTLNNCKGGIISWEYDPGDVHDNIAAHVLITNVGANGPLTTNAGQGDDRNSYTYVTTATTGYGASRGRDWLDILGAVSPSYVVANADIGLNLRVAVQASNSTGSSAFVSSAPVGPVPALVSASAFTNLDLRRKHTAGTVSAW